MSNNYIKIPTITSLQVMNYPLFDYKGNPGNSWVFDPKDGINLMLGANAIGKTTTMNMIIFGFVGELANIDTKYFLDRLKPLEKKQKNQLIILEFRVDNKNVKVKRDLQTGYLKEFRVGSIKMLVSEYDAFMLEHTKVGMNGLSDLLQLMLIRAEEGNYILWDREAQTRIVSLLVNDVDFQYKISKIEEAYAKFDAEYKEIEKQLSDVRKQEVDLQKSKEDAIKEQSKDITEIGLLEKISAYNLQKQKIEDEQKHYQNEFVEQATNSPQIYNSYCDNINKHATLESEVKAKISYIGILKAHLIDEPVIKCNCILCKSSISKEKAKQIYKQYYIDKECPVCDKSTGETMPDNDQNTIKGEIEVAEKTLIVLKNELTDAKKNLEVGESKYNQNKATVEKLRQVIENKRKELEGIYAEIELLRNQLSLLKMKKPIQVTAYDIPIQRMTERITAIRKELKAKETERIDNTREKEEQQHRRNGILDAFYDQLNAIFKRYSKEYFTDGCELVFHPTRHEGQKSVSNFAPQFADVKRIYKTQVSHSEAVFLEYIFRVSLLELYFEISQTKPFLFLETSEGVFDKANTEAAAEMFSTFAYDKFPVVLVANASKDEFTNALFKNKTEQENKTFNLAEYGKPTERQKKHLKMKTLFDPQ